MKYIYYLSLGSNLGDREQYLANAIEGLRRHENIESVTPSKWLETAPWGNTNQGPFLNGACKVVTTLVPEAMLQVMHGSWPALAQVCVLLVWIIVPAVLAARAFRWE